MNPHFIHPAEFERLAYEDRNIYRPRPYGRPNYYNRPRPYWGVPFLGGLAGGLLASTLFPQYGYYGNYPYYYQPWFR
ncbi:hypothetical protein [Jeotgalibacillus terrae]|uniref:Spore coat protein n=1 Tax=Jeotgalibacillus terrae TaxID=587735 RepID=A0ABW5ZFD1_9BACL|nr:hypothetical protein [Jeotgalibacillus terrae]MBM7579345.1 hypothetical protein [Jeotgalibacillus terrae]